MLKWAKVRLGFTVGSDSLTIASANVYLLSANTVLTDCMGNRFYLNANNIIYLD